MLSEFDRNFLIFLFVEELFRLFFLEIFMDCFFVVLLVNVLCIIIGGLFFVVWVFRMFVFLDFFLDLMFSFMVGEDMGCSDFLWLLVLVLLFLRDFDIILKWWVFLFFLLLKILVMVVFFVDFLIRDFWIVILLFILSFVVIVGVF